MVQNDSRPNRSSLKVDHCGPESVGKPTPSGAPRHPLTKLDQIRLEFPAAKLYRFDPVYDCRQNSWTFEKLYRFGAVYDMSTESVDI